MDPVTLTAAGVAGAAAISYLDAKYHISRDLKVIYRLKWAEKEAAKAALAKRQSSFYLWENAVKTFPTARAIWSRTGCYTYQEAHQRVLQYASWLQSLGAKPKDSIGLYAPNSPEFVFIVLATWAIGCYPAMINYNLADGSLVHCVSVAGASILLVDTTEPGLRERVAGSEDKLSELGIKPIYMDQSTQQHIVALPAQRPDNWMRDHAVGAFPFALIYTSGTTGLPKAYPMETARCYMSAIVSDRIMDVRVSKTDPEDREIWYDCMPLYHGTGCVVGFNNLLVGMTIAIGKKFSASSFWKDIHDSKATCFVYVGETARYLLAAPPSPLDRGHNLRMMYGNGLRPDVWEKFQKRFGVPEVLEFFTSTEGVFRLSIWSRSGFGAKSVGHHGLIFRRILNKLYVPVALDPDTNDMWRDPKTGFAKRVPYAQGGEIICKLNSQQEWPGYWNNKEASNKKFAFNVFEKGDVYYRPGDALRRDDDGLWTFMDRLGDTFRWKGENVATTEVQAVMGHFPGIGEANVYGVEIPGSEGRAGCAAVMLDNIQPEAFDWKGLTKHLRQKLPKYAVPIFIRVIRGDPEAMGTHNNKQNKVLLRKEGANMDSFGTEVSGGSEDVMYWLRQSDSQYVPYGKKEWDQVKSRQVKL